ncbi:hypothetical protein AAFF_G00441160 [Aldrovandia affinis]|uniref:Uncharacterized protein n=1 Tax=Aldrovandia affinis TaxID=143900 RepID=A0AAD7S7T4_9TELE|nr:hypothetical protein AAFF_G00441160 [Aldrovandia affinis]
MVLSARNGVRPAGSGGAASSSVTARGRDPAIPSLDSASAPQCPPGRTGDRCERDCDGNHFGPGCSLPCQCTHQAHCDARTGRCVCPVARTGPTCAEGGTPGPAPKSTQPRGRD